MDFAILAACHVAMNDMENARLAAKILDGINSSSSAQMFIQLDSYRDKNKRKLFIDRMVEAGIKP